MKSSPPTTGFPPDLFDATRWSVVVDAADSGLGTASHRALSELCRTYWFPVYVYLRRYPNNRVDTYPSKPRFARLTWSGHSSRYEERIE
jgi:hypothetical protein